MSCHRLRFLLSWPPPAFFLFCCGAWTVKVRTGKRTNYHNNKQMLSWNKMSNNIISYLTQIATAGSFELQSNQGHSDFPLSGHLLQLFWGDTKVFPSQPKCVISPARPETAPGNPPSRICPSWSEAWSFNPLLFSQSNCTLSSFQMTELLTLSLRWAQPPFMEEAHFTSIHSLICSITTQSLFPQVKAGT